MSKSWEDHKLAGIKKATTFILSSAQTLKVEQASNFKLLNKILCIINFFKLCVLFFLKFIIKTIQIKIIKNK